MVIESNKLNTNNELNEMGVDLSSLDERSSLFRVFLTPIRKRGLRGSVQHIRSLGPAGFFRRALYRLRRTIGVAVDRRFDRNHCVDTSGLIWASKVPTDSENLNEGHEYAPVAAKSFRAMLDAVPGDPANYWFVDYGCGKGRALLIAAERFFRRVVGIDYSSPLVKTARRNFSTYRNADLRCNSIEVSHLDAMKFEPPSESLVLFFYSPFKISILKPVLDRITDSYYSNPRAIVVLFVEDRGILPIPIDLFKAMGFLQPVEVPALPFDLGAPHPLDYVVWASPEALGKNS